MKRPQVTELRAAALFLRAEGECPDVAEWLECQADAAEIRAMCAEAGVPVKQFRARLAKHS